MTQDPLSNETVRYMTVGLNSGLSKADFERTDLNLVVVLDTSGSMDSSFDRYYDDGELGIGRSDARPGHRVRNVGRPAADVESICSRCLCCGA